MAESNNALNKPKPDDDRKRLFISYKRDSDPDQTVATEVFEALRQKHDVFIDQTLTVGTRWAERIESELRRADYLVIFLSAQSVNSEMVQGEVETAHHLSKSNNGKPVILPVRLNYREPFQYPLSAYLNPINWAFWGGPSDTPRLVGELLDAVRENGLAADGREPDTGGTAAAESGVLAQPMPSAQPLVSPDDALDLCSDFYIRRSSDDVALRAIQQEGATIVIKGPRQMGKSSLLFRLIDSATKVQKTVAFLDFQLFMKSALSDSDLFFRQFCSLLTDTLELDDRVDEYWASPLGNSQRCTRYLIRHVMPKLSGSLVLAMDEVDTLFDTEFGSDFFGMLRAWHNNRALKPDWRRVGLALVTSTEPYHMIRNLNQSPFNVGEVIKVSDFTRDQASELNRRHGTPFGSSDESRLFELLGGHPYLVRRAFYLVASGRLTVGELFSTATDDGGPFGDHLRYHLFRLHDRKELIEGLTQVIRSNTCRDDIIAARLRGAGLVQEAAGRVVPRCKLYADYFREHLND